MGVVHPELVDVQPGERLMSQAEDPHWRVGLRQALQNGNGLAASADPAQIDGEAKPTLGILGVSPSQPFQIAEGPVVSAVLL